MSEFKSVKTFKPKVQQILETESQKKREEEERTKRENTVQLRKGITTKPEKTYRYDTCHVSGSDIHNFSSWPVTYDVRTCSYSSRW